MNRVRALRWLMLGVGVIAALIVSSPAAAMAPNARDVTAARRLIAAETHFDRAFLAHRADITRAGKRYAAMIKSRCAGSLPASVLVSGTPRQMGVFKDLVREAGFDLYLADTRSVATAERRFANALNRIHFTRLSLIIAVGSIAEGNGPVTPPTDICADVRSAAAGGFAADPPGTARVVRLARQESAGTSPYLPGEIRPYLITSADRAAARTAASLNQRSNNFTNNLILAEAPRVLDTLVGSLTPTAALDE